MLLEYAKKEIGAVSILEWMEFDEEGLIHIEKGELHDDKDWAYNGTVKDPID